MKSACSSNAGGQCHQRTATPERQIWGTPALISGKWCGYLYLWVEVASRDREREEVWPRNDVGRVVTGGFGRAAKAVPVWQYDLWVTDAGAVAGQADGVI